jgi:hypothetical protein
MLQQDRQDIVRWLRQAGRERTSRRLLLRAAAAVSALAGALVLALVLLPFMPGARGWAVLALACLAAVSVLHVLAPLSRRDGAEATARWLARRDPAHGGAVADALQFARELQRRGRVETGSRELAEAHVLSVAAELAGRDPAAPARQAWPVTGGRRALVLLACASLALVALPRSRALLFLGIAPGSRDVALYEGVELRYSFPAYLRLDPRTDFGTGDVQAPTGTHVTVRVEADRPLAWARLELEGGPAQDMEVDGSGAEGRLVVQQDGAYRIVLQGLEGETDPEPPRHAVRAVPDREPTVRLSSPSGETVLPPGGDLDLVWRVADDHGVAELELVIEHEANGEPGEAESRSLARFEPPVLSRVGSRRLSARELGLAPGSSAWLSLKARDADVVTGPKWAASRRVLITARSEDEVRQTVDARQDELAESLLATLGGHLVSAPDRIGERAVLVEASESFESDLQGALRLFEPVLREIEDGPEADLAAVQALEEMRQRLKDLGRTRRRLAGRNFLATSSEERLREQLERLHPPEIRELEKDVLFFDMWSDRRAALRASDGAAELLESLQRLTDELGEPDAQETPESAALDEALEESRQQLDRLAETVRELERAVPDELAAELRAGERAGEAQQLMEDLMSALRRDQLEDARWHGRELQSRGGELARAVQELSDQGAMADQELMEQVRELRRRLADVRAKQTDLRDRTNAVRDEAQDALSPEDRARMDALFDELVALANEAISQHQAGERSMAEAPAVQRFFDALDEVARLRDELRDLITAVSREGRLPSRSEQRAQYELRRRVSELELQTLLGPNDVEPLMRHSEQAREQLGRLVQTLADRDPDAAQRPARHSLYRLDELSQGLERSSDDDLSGRAGPFRAAQARVADVVTKLEELQEQARQAGQNALTDQQRRELEGLGQEQAELGREASELAEALREAGVEAPFLGREVGEAVGRAASSMREARDRLGNGRPSPASESQGDALSRLEDASESLSPQGGRGRRSPSGGEGRGDGRRGLSARESVEIPDADAYRVPKAFREEILQAMRESAAPRGYEEQVREYYRRLVE